MEKGSILRLAEAGDYFMVYVVWKDNGSKKWFPVAKEEGPSWPRKASDIPRFRSGVKGVNVEFSEHGVIVRVKENIRDGNNVRHTYRMVKYEEVQSYDFRMMS